MVKILRQLIGGLSHPSQLDFVYPQSPKKLPFVWGDAKDGPRIDNPGRLKTRQYPFNRIRFPWGSDGFLERRIPGKNGEVSPRPIC